MENACTQSGDAIGCSGEINLLGSSFALCVFNGCSKEVCHLSSFRILFIQCL